MNITGILNNFAENHATALRVLQTTAKTATAVVASAAMLEAVVGTGGLAAISMMFPELCALGEGVVSTAASIAAANAGLVAATEAAALEGGAAVSLATTANAALKTGAALLTFGQAVYGTVQRLTASPVVEAATAKPLKAAS